MALTPLSEVPVGTTYTPLTGAELASINALFPNANNSGAIYNSKVFDPTVVLAASSKVSFTFTGEDASYLNSLGYYAYTGNPFSSLTHGAVNTNMTNGVSLKELAALPGIQMGLVFPNTSLAGSGGLMVPGYTQALGGTLGSGQVFSAGTRIGFFLVQNGWDPATDTVKGWESTDFRDPLVMYSADFLSPENVASSPGPLGSSLINRHFGMIYSDATHSRIYVGVEDQNRNASDHDFNDTMGIITSSVPGALHNTNIPTAPAPVLGSGLALLFMAGSGYFFRRWNQRKVA